jgi:hypothetical protein
VLCLIVVPLPPGKNTFSVKINNNNKIIFYFRHYPGIYLKKLMGMTKKTARTASALAEIRNKYFTKASCTKQYLEI